MCSWVRASAGTPLRVPSLLALTRPQPLTDVEMKGEVDEAIDHRAGVPAAVVPRALPHTFRGVRAAGAHAVRRHRLGSGRPRPVSDTSGASDGAGCAGRVRVGPGRGGLS